MRSLCLSLIGVTAFAGVAAAADVAIPVRVYLNKAGTKTKVVSKGTFTLPDPISDDPTLEGGAITFAQGAASETIALPAGGWSALGNPSGSKGFKYSDPSGATCKRVLVKATGVKALCRATAPGAPPYAAGVDAPITIELALGTPSHRYCGECPNGGVQKGNPQNLTNLKDCQAPVSCPSPPSPTPTPTATPSTCAGVAYSESFALSDGAPWPAPWVELGSSVNLADIQGGRARFRPEPDPFYSLGRLYAPISEVDVEATFTVEFEDLDTQGVGFYVRQNGGYLTDTVPTGQGYAVFIEGFRGFHGIGVWYEENGAEIPISINMGLSLSNGVPYRVRFRVTQASATATWLRARIWEEGDPEPATWHVESLDSTAVLQNVAGGLALDSWSELTTPSVISAHTLVDDIEVQRLCNPLQGIGTATPIAETFQFLEGPRWRPNDGVLLFTDVTANTIYELTPPAAVAVFRSPSNNANGLANDINGDLLACEHQTRSVTRTDSVGTITTVADNFSGDAFNSPNDIAVHSNGTIYFTDPRYGLPGPPELAFNGLFRRQTDGTLTVEFSGHPVNNGPNGVDLSPDESLLYMTDTAAGALLAWDVAPDGSLSNQRTLASGIFIPDGMCVDTRGNVYVASWSNAIRVFDPNGTLWGDIPIPRPAANCGFGGADASTIYVTAQQGLYSVSAAVPGLY